MKRKRDEAPPANWQDFEDLCLRLWRPRLIEVKKNGRVGQPQAGVDIFGRDPKITEMWVGIQCKQKGRWPPKVLTICQIKDEVRKASRFKPPLSQFIIATTAQRDARSQEFVRRLGYWRRKSGNFTVDLFAWDDLQEWLQEGPEPISREKALWLWRQRILRHHSRLMPYFQERSAPLLEHLYVELQLDPERVRSMQSADLEAPRSMELLSRRLSIREVLDLDPVKHEWITHRWLLRGDPGAGKTTLLRHLAWTLAEAGGKPWVPVFESLSRLMTDRLPVFGRIEEELERADQPGAEIRRILEEEAGQGRLVLLLDGLDEVPREARDRAESLLSELAARWPKSPIVATTRPIGAWSPGAEFLELEVLPFDAERRRAFLERWFAHEDSENAVSAASLLEADQGLRELAANPLYLTLLALLIQSGEEPARHRSKLFDQIFDLLEEGRHHKPPTPIDNRAAAHRGLCGLAYQMTKDNRDGEAVQALERRLLKDRRLQVSLKLSWPRVRCYLDDVSEKTGILGPHDGPEADWRFWHRTFREALTAERLAEALAGERRGGGKCKADDDRLVAEGLRRLWQRVSGRGMPGLLRHARRIARGDLGRWAEPYALLTGRVREADDLVRALVKENRALGLRALATAQGLKAETLAEVLELSEEWQERRRVYERLPELIDDPLRALALADQLRQRTRNGNDLFFLERAIAAVAERWPDSRRAVEGLQKRFFDHIPPPSELLLSQRTQRRLDREIEVWREIPAGRYWLGSPEGKDGAFCREWPEHESRLRSTFWMATAPITVAQYAAFDPQHRSHYSAWESDEELSARPVTVSWYQAFAYCRWLSESLPWAQGARLPTEEEWVCALSIRTEDCIWPGDENDYYPFATKPREWTLSSWTDIFSGREGGVDVDPATINPTDYAESSDAARVTTFNESGRHSEEPWGPMSPCFRVCIPADPKGR